MKVTVNLGATAVVVNFGVNWLYHHYLKTTGHDLLVEGLDDVGTSKTFETCADLYYAGYLAECSMNHTEPVETKESFMNWVMQMPPLEVGALLQNYYKTLTPAKDKKPGEPKPNQKKAAR